MFAALASLLSWSRSLDPIGWIWRVLVAISSPVLLRWQERWLQKELRLGISINKAVLPSSYRKRALVSGVCGGVICVCGVFPWWKTQQRRLAPGMFNKLAVWVLSRRDPSFFPVPARRGDGGEGDVQALVNPAAVARRVSKEERLALQEAATTFGRVPKRWQSAAIATLGQGDHSALGMVPGRFLPPWRRIFKDLLTGFPAGVAPSGKFPGGCAGACSRSSWRCGGEGLGPVCVFTFCSMVFFVFLKDLVVLPAGCGVLYVSLYPPTV